MRTFRATRAWQAAVESPISSPVPFSTHHNVICLNWYCSCAVAAADEDCWCEELTGHKCESCHSEMEE
jgi:hypothetical protein